MRILFCEDDKDLGHAIHLMLCETGHEVDYVVNADQGVALFDASLNSAPYDLILTDVEMDGHSGLYLASHARTMGFKGRLAVLTGYEKEKVLPQLQQVKAEYWSKMSAFDGLSRMVSGIDSPTAEGMMGVIKFNGDS
ncbi:MAG TPA: response regulator [Abditibacterium sp.]|jgi:DNA-binding response OmpR family regulator